MNMHRPSAGISPLCFSYILVILLLCESTRPVQSIALSSLCGQFGHSCFGGKNSLKNLSSSLIIDLGNWGKRDLPIEEYSQSNLVRNNDGTTISDENSLNNFLYEQIRLVNISNLCEYLHVICLFLESTSTTITRII